MAIIKIQTQQIELNDGDKIKDACARLEVPFGCHSGICGVCKIKILEGVENLSELSQEGRDIGLNSNQRLACQTKIKSGVVKIEIEY